MKYFRAIMVLAVLVACLSAFRALAKDAPVSAIELVKRLEQALQAKNKGAAMDLFDWQGVSKEMRAKQEAIFALLFEQEVKSVKRGRLPAKFPLEQEVNGVRYRPNVAVVGVINVKCADEDNPTEAVFTYGKKNKVFYLATLIEDKTSNQTGR